MNRNFELLYKGRDFSLAMQEVLDNLELFEASEIRQNFEGSPFKDTRFIPCRMTYESDIDPEWTQEELLEYRKTKGVTSRDAVDVAEYEALPIVYSEVMSICSALRAEQIGRVLVAELQPGGHILAHYDYGPYHDFYDRVHLVIGGEGCHFRAGKEVVKMLPNEVWAFNNRANHEVWNESAVARYHIIIDMKLKGERIARWPEVTDYKNNA